MLNLIHEVTIGYVCRTASAVAEAGAVEWPWELSDEPT
jgi:hypothetical protein